MNKTYEIKNKTNYDNSALKLMILLTLAYVISYVGRKSYDSNVNEIMSFYGASKSQAGLIGTFFFIVYACGQVFHGIMCKHYNPKIVLPLALTVASCCNLLMGIMPVSGFKYLKYVWLLNGFVMASLWSVIIRLLNRSLSKKRIKQSLLFMAFPVSIGTFIIYGISATFSLIGRFKYTFYVASALLIGISVVLFFSLDKLIYKSKVERIESDGDESVVLTDVKDYSKKTKIEPAFFVIFGVLAVFAIINNFVKDGLTTWTPTIFTEKFKLENWFSVLLTILLPIFAVVGSTFAILISKKIKSYVVICGLLYAIASIVLALLLAFLNLNSWVITLVCFMLISAVMAGVNNVITNIFPLQVKNVDAGFIAGLIDGFCYVGSAISSFGLGAIVEAFSNNWDPVMYLFLGLCAFSVVVCVVYVGISKLKKDKNGKNV